VVCLDIGEVTAPGPVGPLGGLQGSVSNESTAARCAPWVRFRARVEDAQMATDKKILNLHDKLMVISREEYNL
jgi:hypothetical protein